MIHRHTSLGFEERATLRASSRIQRHLQASQHRPSSSGTEVGHHPHIHGFKPCLAQDGFLGPLRGAHRARVPTTSCEDFQQKGEESQSRSLTTTSGLDCLNVHLVWDVHTLQQFLHLFMQSRSTSFPAHQGRFSTTTASASTSSLVACSV